MKCGCLKEISEMTKRNQHISERETNLKTVYFFENFDKPNCECLMAPYNVTTKFMADVKPLTPE